MKSIESVSKRKDKWAPTKHIVEKWRRPSVADDVKVCKICDKELVEGRTLPCVHSFCQSCILLLLRTYEKANKLERTFHCPVCSFRIPCHIIGKVSVEWLDMFPRKSLMDKMKEAIVVVEEICRPCSVSWKVTPATMFCVDCQEYLCPECDGNHRGQPNNKGHNIVQYEVKEMKNVPVSNVSKFQCKLHKSLRYTGYCEVHQVFVCNNCKQTTTHKHCRVISRVIEANGRITKAETKINVINSLKRDERNRGKQLIGLIEQIDGIQKKLQSFRHSVERRYCNHVLQMTITEQKTEAIDALKGKLEFVKVHRPHDAVWSTMNTVEDILTQFADVVNEDDKPERAQVAKGISDIERILCQSVYDCPAIKQDEKHPRDYEFPEYHACRRHVEYAIDQDSLVRLGTLMNSVGALCFNKMVSTAFRVGSKYLMTTANTVRDIVDPYRAGECDWSALERKNVFVSFESRPKPEGKVYRLSQQVPFMDDTLNVAVLEITDPDPLPPPLVLSTRDIGTVGVEEVSVIGFGQRGSRNKCLDFKCEIIKLESDRAKQAVEWLELEEKKFKCHLFMNKRDPAFVHWHYNEMKDPSRVAIDCCLGDRALGSPAITKTGPRGAEVMAVFGQSVPDCYSDLPESAQAKYKDFEFALATKMSSVYNTMVVERRTLADDIFVRDKNYFEGMDELMTDDSVLTSFAPSAASTPRTSVSTLR